MAVSTLNQVSNLGFFDLPRELRDEVYKYVASQDPKYRNEMVCQFARTCPQIKTELYHVVLQLDAMVFEFFPRSDPPKERSPSLIPHYVQFLALLDPEEEDVFLSRPIKISTTVRDFVDHSLATHLAILHDNCRAAPRFRIECAGSTAFSAAETSGVGHLHSTDVTQMRTIIRRIKHQADEVGEAIRLKTHLSDRSKSLGMMGWVPRISFVYPEGVSAIKVLMERAAQKVCREPSLHLADLARSRLQLGRPSATS
ncbi:MAG: hypothetical protein Q9165_001235 [Trypethelium subeluteriae]